MQAREEVLVVSDEPINRQAIVALLERATDAPVEGREALPGCPRGIVLVAWDLLRHVLHAEMPLLLQLATAVVVMSGPPDPGDALLALEAGALGYLSRRAAASDVLAAVGAATAGEVYVESALGRAMAGLVARRPIAAPQLTPREREVAALLASGLTTKQIASSLFIGGSTAKSHVGGIYAKLGVSSRAAAVARLAQTGLLAELLS